MTVHFRKMLQLFGGLIEERLNLRKLEKTNGETDVMDILLNLSNDIDRTHMEHMFVVRILFVPLPHNNSNPTTRNLI